MNKIFLGMSLDGFIAKKDGSTEWLQDFPNEQKSDYGYEDFIQGIDAILMGKNTYLTVKGFKFWPYEKKVFIFSSTLQNKDLIEDKDLEIVGGRLSEIIQLLHSRGFKNLYVDGGKTFQLFFNEGLVDEIIITTVPIILGKGIRLFENLETSQKLTLIDSKVFEESGIIQSHYKVQK